MFSRRTGWKLTPNRFTLAHQEVLRNGREVRDLTISNPTRAGLKYDETAILDSDWIARTDLPVRLISYAQLT